MKITTVEATFCAYCHGKNMEPKAVRTHDGSGGSVKMAWYCTDCGMHTFITKEEEIDVWIDAMCEGKK